MGAGGRAQAALDELVARYGMEHEQRAQLESILTMLAADRHPPTAVRAPDEAVDVHLADSLVALELIPVRAADRIADLGAGAGFPGVALAVALPGAEVALVESQRRRCDFLERLSVSAGITNARAVWARAEEWHEGIGEQDVVVARALAPQPVVLEYAAPLLRVGGTLVDWRGRHNPAEEGRSLAAARKLGLELAEIRRVSPFQVVRDRYLHLYLKVRDTPSRFPRRAGIARKRPL